MAYSLVKKTHFLVFLNISTTLKDLKELQY